MCHVHRPALAFLAALWTCAMVCLDEPVRAEGRPCREICDDGNVCTDDFCVPEFPGFCGHEFNTANCDDGNICTDHDACSLGSCAGVPTTSTRTCDDSNVCTATDRCSGGTCAGSPVSCDDGNFCTLDFCNPLDGCFSIATVCDDGNQCTQDSCDPATGCRSLPLPGAPCSDGNHCTLGDVCVQTSTGGALCQPGAPADCNDQNACTRDSCLSSVGCVHSTFVCDDANLCTTDMCDPATGCVFVGPPGEAGPVRFMDEVTLVWDPASEAEIHNTYRGSILRLGGMGSRSSGPYDHLCFESGDAQQDGPTVTVDSEPLSAAPGPILYYLVSGELFCGEGTLGIASDGGLRPNRSPCPTPPP